MWSQNEKIELAKCKEISFCCFSVLVSCNIGKSLLTFSKYQSVEINPCVSFRMLIFNGLPTLAEYTLKGLVLEIQGKKRKVILILFSVLFC